MVYRPIWRADFLAVDDHEYVTGNPVVLQGLTWHGFVWAFDGVHVANYHPLTWLSHMLDCQLFGSSPRGPHAVNLILHCVNVLLLFAILRKFTGREWPSAIVAAVFAIHPQHVESVAWISERKDMLSGLFWMLTILAYGGYVAAGGGWKRYALVMLALAAGLLSKPTLVTLPCVLLLLDAWPLGRTRYFQPALEGVDWPARARSIPSLLVEKIPLFALALTSSVVTFLAQKVGGAVSTLEMMPMSMRIGNAIVSYVRYLWTFVLPVNCSAFYPLLRPWPLAGVFASFLLLIALTAWFTWCSRRRPYLGVGWLWFLGTLVPMIGIVQVGQQAMADRYMYLPLVGLAVMIVWFAADLVRDVELSTRTMQFMATAAGCALLILATVSATDASYWTDTEPLFRRALARTEPNAFALFNTGMGAARRHDYDRGVADLRIALAQQPSNPHLRRAIGYILREANRYDEARAELTLALQLDDKLPLAWAEMGQLSIDQKKWTDAVACYTKAAKLAPDNFNDHLNLAIAYRMSGQNEPAIAELKQAIAINPIESKPPFMLGQLLLESNRPVDAIAPLARSVSLEPTFADAQLALGTALMRSGHGDRAVGPLMAAMQLAPASPEPVAQLAWLLATHPNDKVRRGEDAMFLANHAMEMTRSASPKTLDTLAAAMAEQQKFDQAAATASKAAELARSSGDQKLAGEIETRLQHYRAHQPVRDTTLAGSDAGEVVP